VQTTLFAFATTPLSASLLLLPHRSVVFLAFRFTGSRSPLSSAGWATTLAPTPRAKAGKELWGKFGFVARFHSNPKVYLLAEPFFWHFRYVNWRQRQKSFLRKMKKIYQMASRSNWQKDEDDEMDGAPLLHCFFACVNWITHLSSFIFASSGDFPHLAI